MSNGFVLGQAQAIEPARESAAGMVAGEEEDRAACFIVERHRARLIGVKQWFSGHQPLVATTVIPGCPVGQAWKPWTPTQPSLVQSGVHGFRARGQCPRAGMTSQGSINLGVAGTELRR